MRLHQFAIVATSWTAMLATALPASDKGRQVNPTNAPPAATAPDGEKLVYVPPRVKPETSKARVVAVAMRNGPADPPTFAVLSPDHVGLTVQEQPSLFWYLSKPTKTRLVMTLMKDGDSDPALEVTLDGSRNGIQRLDLRQQKIKLLPDVQYEISMALVSDPGHRDKDILASGVIKRVPPPEDLLANLQKRPRAIERAILLARSGIWFDAIATLSDQIDSDSRDKVSRAGRATLLDQVNLPDAASFDRAQGQAP